MNRLAAMFALLAVFVLSLAATTAVAWPEEQCENWGKNCPPTTTNEDPPCEPQEAYTETTDWVLTSPGEGWYQVDERTVVDEEGGTVVVTEAQHYSYTGGPVDELPGSTPPGGDWQANTTQEPHLNNPTVTWVDGFGVGLHFTGEEGRANFFYFQPEVTETVPPVTHQEYKFAFDHPAVECPPDDEEPPPPPPPDDEEPPPNNQPPDEPNGGIGTPKFNPPTVVPTTSGTTPNTGSLFESL